MSALAAWLELMAEEAAFILRAGPGELATRAQETFEARYQPAADLFKGTERQRFEQALATLRQSYGSRAPETDPLVRMSRRRRRIQSELASGMLEQQQEQNKLMKEHSEQRLAATHRRLEQWRNQPFPATDFCSVCGMTLIHCGCCHHHHHSQQR